MKNSIFAVVVSLKMSLLCSCLFHIHKLGREWLLFRMNRELLWKLNHIVCDTECFRLIFILYNSIVILYNSIVFSTTKFPLSIFVTSTILIIVFVVSVYSVVLIYLKYMELNLLKHTLLQFFLINKPFSSFLSFVVSGDFLIMTTVAHVCLMCV